MKDDNDDKYREEAVGVGNLLEISVPDTVAYIIAYVRDEGDGVHGAASVLLNGKAGALYPLAKEILNRVKEAMLEGTSLSDMEHPLDSLGGLSLGEYLELLEKQLREDLEEEDDE
jgi:hypothetical protein